MAWCSAACGVWGRTSHAEHPGIRSAAKFAHRVTETGSVHTNFAPSQADGSPRYLGPPGRVEGGGGVVRRRRVEGFG
eukprot:8975951-Pyramimonas_sp.AAC.1